MTKNTTTKTIEEISQTPLKARTVKEEYRLAKHENRQPFCIYCGEPLEIYQNDVTYLAWVWSDTKKNYIEDDGNGDSDTPCCKKCDVADWDFFGENGYSVDY